MLIIRKASVEDVELLASLGYRTFYETYATYNSKSDMDKYLSEKFTPAQIAKELNEPSASFLIAEVDGEPAGYMKISSGSPPEGLNAIDALELERIYVLEKQHRKGIGNKLLDYCIGYAKQKGHAVIWLIVWQQNLNALNFYISKGFTKFGVKKFVLGDDIQDDYMMKLELH